MKSKKLEFESLPDDIDALKALIVEQSKAIEHLQVTAESYRRLLFAPKSERRADNDPMVDESAVQQHLLFAEIALDASEASKALGVATAVEDRSTDEKPKSKKKGGRRRTYPDHLPVIRTTYELPPAERTCSCGCELHEIGLEIRKELERVEVCVVHELAQQSYGCRNCSNIVVTAPGPERVIEKGILGVGFLAQVALERFLNHLPYYRLEKKYASEGLDLNRSVLQRSMSRVAELLEPIWRQLQSEVLASDVIHTDDTTVTIARGKDGRSRKGNVWIYLDLEGRHFYDFTESRSSKGPEAIIGSFKGYVHADAYPGYDAIFDRGEAVEVACWAHARRYFVQSESTDPDLAKEALARIRILFEIEKAGKDLSSLGRQQLRAERAAPILNEFEVWLESVRLQVLPKSPMAKAVTYVLNNWQALQRYVDDGRLRIDNNAAERAMRPIAVGRKNWLFYQNDTGGRTAAILMSLIESAKAAQIDPRTYLRDVLIRISHEPDVAKLTPLGWKEKFADRLRAQRNGVLHDLISQ